MIFIIVNGTLSIRDHFDSRRGSSHLRCGSTPPVDPSLAHMKGYRSCGKTFRKPKRPFEKERLDAEMKIVGEYGPKNKREVWRVQYALAKMPHCRSASVEAGREGRAADLPGRCAASAHAPAGATETKPSTPPTLRNHDIDKSSKFYPGCFLRNSLREGPGRGGTVEERREKETTDTTTRPSRSIHRKAPARPSQTRSKRGLLVLWKRSALCMPGQLGVDSSDESPLPSKPVCSPSSLTTPTPSWVGGRAVSSATNGCQHTLVCGCPPSPQVATLAFQIVHPGNAARRRRRMKAFHFRGGNELCKPAIPRLDGCNDRLVLEYDQRL